MNKTEYGTKFEKRSQSIIQQNNHRDFVLENLERIQNQQYDKMTLLRIGKRINGVLDQRTMVADTIQNMASNTRFGDLGKTIY